MTSQATFDHMIHAIAHDFRATLRALDQVPDWIETDLFDAGIELPPEVVEHFALLRDAVSRGSLMANGLLSYARAGDQLGELADISLSEIAMQAWLSVDAPPGFLLDIEPLDFKFVARANSIARVLEILFANTVAHNVQDDVNVLVFAQQTKGNIILRVEDDGLGVPEAQWKSMFMPLALLSHRTRNSGAGMGLSIAQRLVTQDGGTISAVHPGTLSGFGVEITVPLVAVGA